MRSSIGVLGEDSVNPTLSIKILLKLSWKMNYASQIHWTVHLDPDEIGFGGNILNGESNCWEKGIRDVFFQGVRDWTTYVEMSRYWGCQGWEHVETGHVFTKMAMHADCMHMRENEKELVGNVWWNEWWMW